MSGWARCSRRSPRPGSCWTPPASHPTSEGTRITWSGGKFSQVDGPFTETKEVIGGYSIAQCKDKAEALEWAKRFLEIHPPEFTLTVEVREIAEG